MTQQGRRESKTAAVPITVGSEHLVTALDLIADGLAVVDESGAMVFVNRQLCEMFGYSALDLVGKPIEILVPTDRRRNHRRDRADFAEHGGTRSMGRRDLDIEGRHSTGRHFPIDVQLAPLPQGGLIAATVRDMHHQRQAAADAAVQRIDLQAALQRVATLVAAHDLVLQRLFALGAHLEAQVSLAAPEVKSSFTDAVTVIDGTIQSVRGASFE